MSKPYTNEQIKEMWLKDMEKRKDASPEFKKLMYWMFDFEEYKKVMKLAHLPNPCLTMIKKDQT